MPGLQYVVALPELQSVYMHQQKIHPFLGCTLHVAAVIHKIKRTLRFITSALNAVFFSDIV